MTKRILFAFSSVLLACDPDPENLGTGDVETDTASWAVEWRVQSDVETYYYDVAALSDGGALLLEFESTYGRSTIRRFSADGAASILVSERTGHPNRVIPTSSSVFYSFDGGDPDIAATRASVRRFSLSGEMEAEYVHPREGEGNAFAMGLAVAADEVALVIGNWGGLDLGEAWFLVQRLDLDLQPLGDPFPFDHEIEDVAYDAAGRLLLLEGAEEGPGRLHRPGTAALPLSIACDTFLADHGDSLCASSRTPGVIIDFERNTTREADVSSLGRFALPARTPSSALFFGLEGEQGRGEVVEVDDDGEVGRTALVDFGPDVFGVTNVAVESGTDGSAYVVAFEHVEPQACDQGGNGCVRSYLVRLAP